MTRRLWCKAVAAALVTWAAVWPRRTYGYVDVEAWWSLGFARRGARVFLDERDITDDCVSFNDREGWAEVLKRNEHGHAYLDATRRRPALAILHGTIEVRDGVRV